ncbi:hypothetical protein [Arthrobacter sp. H14-L1]|uniref:hypothetical protein n=1 Tax=Arthrobacter sp. H14-L1 TaxID=2996697 RepID=UPI002272060F|nr:hypothetical protein [Arthrobacter sp. H14-L1]MCY0904817.1 hypothetical protein [Arthrobacter sp. H14-L1]
MAKTPAQRAAKHGGPAASPTQPAVVARPGSPAELAKATGNGNLLLLAASVATVLLFWYFHLLTLEQMTQLSNGQPMPDSLFGGFDRAYIHQLRGSMDADARGQLQFVHKTAGTLFPLVFGFTWLILIGVNVRRPAVRRALWAAPALFAVVQLCANFAVDGMLASETLAGGQVALASFLVVASWVLLLVSLLAGATALVLGWRRKRNSRGNGANAGAGGSPSAGANSPRGSSPK